MRIKTLYTIITYLSPLVFLMAFVPLLHTGIPTGHDILPHLIYLRKFQDAIFSGQFPVRFNDWFVPGLNQPLSNFYQPAFYYIFLIPRLIGIPNTEALKIVILGLWLVSGSLMYLFTKRHFGHLGGIIGAAFYMFAPYHIEDFVVRAAFSEFTALSFTPGIFWAIKAFWDASFPVVILGSPDVSRGDSRISMVERDSGQARMTVSTKKGLYLSLLSIFIALVVLSHPPTLIMYIPLIVGYVGYLTYLAQSAKRKAQNYSSKLKSFNFGLLISLLLSLGLLAFFVLPALFEQKYIQIIYMRSGYYDFHNHFVCLTQLFVPNWGYGLSTNGCQDGMSFQIGLPHLLVVGMVVYFLVDALLSFPRKRESRARSGFPIRSGMTKGEAGMTEDRPGMTALPLLFLSFLAFYLFMTLEISLPFWENLPLVPFIQYSWRFLAVIMFVTSFLAASVPEGVRTVHLKGVASNKSLIAFAILILLLPLSYAWYLHPLRYFGKNELDFDSPKFLDGVKPETGNLLPETGYMPKWAEVLPPIDEIPESEARILKGDANINVVKLAAHRKEYVITSVILGRSTLRPTPESPSSEAIRDAGQASMTRVRFYTHYFPGWKVRVDGKESSFSYDNIYGYMDVPLPKGKHEVTLSFENTPIRTAGNWISIFSILAVVGLIFFPKKRS